jgi:gas vesicle protein
MPIITVEKPLKDRLGDEGVDSLIRLLNQSQQNQKQDLMVYLEEKYEHRLGEEIGAISITIAETEKRLDNRITEEIGKVNERLTEEIGKVNERLTEEIGKVNERLTEEIGKVNERLTEEIGKVNERITKEIADVKVEISNVRSDASKNHANLIKWMFIFWMGQVIALVGILFAFFK